MESRPRALIATLALVAGLACGARSATVKLFAYDDRGRTLDLQGLLAVLSRADSAAPRDPARAPVWAAPVDASAPIQRVRLAQTGPMVTASWDGGPAALRLVWPVADDGYSSVSADDAGHGFADGAAVFLDEEIALTEYRKLKDAMAAARGPDAPGRKESLRLDAAKRAIAKAETLKDSGPRARAFARALRAVSLADETWLFERGRRRMSSRSFRNRARFGLTLDAGVLRRLGDLDWIADSLAGVGANWARVVFAPNPRDFLYARAASFDEYDGVVAALTKRGVKVMGCVLDTAQWPRAMTPAIYAARAGNLAAHYRGRVASWEVGNEINGDWLGGARAPLSPEQVFAIYSAAPAAVRAADPRAEIEVSLYWWEETAPDRAHSLSGWLADFVPKGFGRGVDAVGLDVFPEDNPAGLGLERGFLELSHALPSKTLLLSSFGYVEGDKLLGYWWLSPENVDGARKDLTVLYTAASCAMPGSVCGGFWWQTLDQLLPPGRRRATDLFRVYARGLYDLRR